MNQTKEKVEMCLSCGYLQVVTEENTYYDELGKHTVCDDCEASFDID